MSRENVELIRRVYAAVAGNDLETAYGCLHPEIEFHTYANAPAAGVYRGRDSTQHAVPKGGRQEISVQLAELDHPRWSPRRAPFLLHASGGGRGRRAHRVVGKLATDIRDVPPLRRDRPRPSVDAADLVDHVAHRRISQIDRGAVLVR
jgi:ketosteroid isomerase-like protein